MNFNGPHTKATKILAFVAVSWCIEKIEVNFTRHRIRPTTVAGIQRENEKGKREDITEEAGDIKIQLPASPEASNRHLRSRSLRLRRHVTQHLS
jgi:hypothetical protein